MTIEKQDRNHRVLVIDDMVEIHTVFRRLLGRKRRQPDLNRLESSLFGAPAPEVEPVFDVDCASQGEAGLVMVRAALAEGRPYALAFVDMRMPPGWDGVQTIHAIWAEDPDLEVVICSAYTDYSDHELATRLGATDQMLFLRKPFEAVEARQLVRALVEKRELRHRSLRKATLETNVAPVIDATSTSPPSDLDTPS